MHMKKIANFAALALLALLGPARAEVMNVSCSAGQTSDIVQIRTNTFVSGISLLAKASSITGDYTVEVANDPPLRPNLMNYVFRAAEATSVTHWVAHNEMAEQVGDALSNIIVPVQFVRLNCGNISGGSVNLGVGIAGHQD